MAQGKALLYVSTFLQGVAPHPTKEPTLFGISTTEKKPFKQRLNKKI
jgi:hypothetical protein